MAEQEDHKIDNSEAEFKEFEPWLFRRSSNMVGSTQNCIQCFKI